MNVYQAAERQPGGASRGYLEDIKSQDAKSMGLIPEEVLGWGEDRPGEPATRAPSQIGNQILSLW